MCNNLKDEFETSSKNMNITNVLEAQTNPLMVTALE